MRICISIESLSLRGNRLTSISLNVTSPFLQNLKYLDVGRKQISTFQLTGDLLSYPTIPLERLYLDHNQLQEFPVRTFSVMPQLRFIAFQGNIFKYIFLLFSFDPPIAVLKKTNGMPDVVMQALAMMANRKVNIECNRLRVRMSERGRFYLSDQLFNERLRSNGHQSASAALRAPIKSVHYFCYIFVFSSDLFHIPSFDVSSNPSSIKLISSYRTCHSLSRPSNGPHVTFGMMCF